MFLLAMPSSWTWAIAKTQAFSRPSTLPWQLLQAVGNVFKWAKSEKKKILQVYPRVFATCIKCPLNVVSRPYRQLTVITQGLHKWWNSLNVPLFPLKGETDELLLFSYDTRCLLGQKHHTEVKSGDRYEKPKPLWILGFTIKTCVARASFLLCL